MMTDQAMPGMTGVELAEIVRRERPNMPVLLATGYADLLDGAEVKLAAFIKTVLPNAIAGRDQSIVGDALIGALAMGRRGHVLGHEWG